MTEAFAPDLRFAIDSATYGDERAIIAEQIRRAGLSESARARICKRAARFVEQMRSESRPGMMESFLAEYGLSSQEGVELMSLAEALLRVPDAATADLLIHDKIATSDWAQHLGHSRSSLVNASTWGLMMTGKVLGGEDSVGGAMRRLGSPVIRGAMQRAMREMGRQFVLGEDMPAALKRARAQERKGYRYSYDMLGEAARTFEDADTYYAAYKNAIDAIARVARPDASVQDNPGISVKLSALHPRYERARKAQVLEELAPRLLKLCQRAAKAGIGLAVDAEEANRLDLSLDLIETVLASSSLAGWEGFGVVVQAYGLRATPVLDWLYRLTGTLERRISVRLVKGAYWDSEIKDAQVAGVKGFPVFTSKAATDIAYIANARRLLEMGERIYPQFATHNAHTVAAILDIAQNMPEADPSLRGRRAGGVGFERFEFQRLHGMGESLHEMVMRDHGTRCRIYAPVGAHRDLLAYLVRRLLENGANSSFVNQIMDPAISPEQVVRDPFESLEESYVPVAQGPELFLPERPNSLGFDLSHDLTLEHINAARAPWREVHWKAAPLVVGKAPSGEAVVIRNPARPVEIVGEVRLANAATVEAALAGAQLWQASHHERACVLREAATLYEAHFGELFALLAREAGKTLPDAVAELREAVDFLRYYASQPIPRSPVGVMGCISPWNFPLAIFTGQIAAALRTGNAVVAKPAEQTPLIAYRAVELLHQAGVPLASLQLLPGGREIGAALSSSPAVGGIAFTGSTATARRIQGSMAEHLAPGAPLLAETGGINAMIVDSTALPEQAVEAILESAFQSAGQRCSALRCLYVQKDIAPRFKEMLAGAMACLRPGDPWKLASDSGPLIDANAHAAFHKYVAKAARQGRVIAQGHAPDEGHFFAPTLIEVDSISDIGREIFGPVLHVAEFHARDLDQVIADINATGYGLTFGLHSRIEERISEVNQKVRAGNVYVNRNQIGAIVGSQPFGGEGLSGTGPKAGGPHYLMRFTRAPRMNPGGRFVGEMDGTALRKALAYCQQYPQQRLYRMPGPTGEMNHLSTHSRAPLLCLGPGTPTAASQAETVRAMGGIAIEADGHVSEEILCEIAGLGGVIWWGDQERARVIAQALARRSGPIIPLITGMPDPAHCLEERHLCVDTTASGGNAALLGATQKRRA